MHHPGSVCPGCGGTRFSKIGEDVTEVLEKIPARLKVIRHIRPKLNCRSCERIVQAPTPDLPIETGRPGPGLVANVVVGKYLDGLPLYRQSAILAREGIEIERATLADWVGHVAWRVMPLAELIGAQFMAAPVIHTDDTPIVVLAPGNGKTKTGRLWTYVLDERPWQGGRASAVYYRFSPDRRGERPRDHLASFRGVIQADAYSGYEALARSAASLRGPIGRGPPRLIHAAFWAHARRKFYDVFEATKSPLAREALKRIGERREEPDEEGRQLHWEHRGVALVLPYQRQTQNVVGEDRLALGPCRDIAAKTARVRRVLPRRVIPPKPCQARGGPIPYRLLYRLEVDVRPLAAG